MKILEKNIKDNQITALLKMDPEEFAAALKEAYLNDTEHYPVPGYAAGLAPREEIEKIYGREALWDEALNESLPVMYSAFLLQEKIRVFGRPAVKDISHTDGGIVFCVTAEMYPQVILGRYQGLEVGEKAARDEKAFRTAVLEAACRNMTGGPSEAMIESRLDSLEAREKLSIAGEPMYHLLADVVEVLDRAYRETGVSRPMKQVREEAMDIMLQTVSGDNQDISWEFLGGQIRQLAGQYRTIPPDFAKTMKKLFADRSEKKSRLSPAEIAAEAFSAYLGSLDIDEEGWRAEHRREAADSARCDLLLEAVAEAERLAATGEEVNEMLLQIAGQCGVEMEQVIEEVNIESVKQQLIRDKACRLIMESAAATQ